MSLEEAIARFREAAIEKGDYAEPASRDKELHAELSAAWRALWGRGEVGQKAFKALLTDDSRHVRCWVASQLLAGGDESGSHVLQVDVAEGGLQGFASAMVLKEWKAGRLGFPLGSMDV